MNFWDKNIRERMAQLQVEDIMKMPLSFEQQYELIKGVYEGYQETRNTELLKDGIPL